MKHFVVVLDWAAEYECGTNVIGVAHSLEDAKKIFEGIVGEEREYAKDHEWIVYDDLDTVFEAGEDGRYMSNHTNLFIEEV